MIVKYSWSIHENLINSIFITHYDKILYKDANIICINKNKWEIAIEIYLSFHKKKDRIIFFIQ